MLVTFQSLENSLEASFKKKGMVLYSAVSSPLDRSKRFTLSSPGRPVHSDTVLGFSWKHSSHAAIAQRLFTHISTTVYSQVLIYTAESTEASWSERKCPHFETVTTGFEPGLCRLRVRHSTNWATALSGASRTLLQAEVPNPLRSCDRLDDDHMTLRPEEGCAMDLKASH